MSIGLINVLFQLKQSKGGAVLQSLGLQRKAGQSIALSVWVWVLRGGMGHCPGVESVQKRVIQDLGHCRKKADSAFWMRQQSQFVDSLGQANSSGPLQCMPVPALYSMPAPACLCQRSSMTAPALYSMKASASLHASTSMLMPALYSMPVPAFSACQHQHANASVPACQRQSFSMPAPAC
eukprot:1142640-Pelagomonas_calceolata.AAC.12